MQKTLYLNTLGIVLELKKNGDKLETMGYVILVFSYVLLRGGFAWIGVE